MNAYEIPNLRFSLPAGGEVARHRFVSVDASGNGIQSTADTAVIGVSMNAADNTDQIVEVADGIVMVEAAGTITAGTVVYSDGTGKATATGSEVAGVAITSAAAGELVSVKL